MHEASSPPTSEIGPVVSHLQSDTFCAGCGYNLNTQAVLRDGRLDLLVCRCPECGRYAAAGQGTSAARTWLHRLGILLLVVWILFLLLIFGLGTMALGGLSYGSLMAYVTYYQPQPVVGMNTLSSPTYVMAYYQLRQFGPPDQEIATDIRLQAGFIGLCGGALAFLLGGLYAVFFWHLKGWRRYLCLIMPILGVGGATFSWAVDRMTIHIRDWGLSRLALFFAVEVAAMLVGVFAGRPIMRGVLGILLPPKVRQHLSFLWLTDGKKMKIDAPLP